MHGEDWIKEELESLRAGGLERRLGSYPAAGPRIRINGRTFLNYASNDYLNLAHHPDVIAASRGLLEELGCSSCASRLLTGALECHAELERRIAAFKRYPAALVFGSGFLANLGIIPAVVGRDDLVYVDRLAHASIIDAIVRSRATMHRFRHNDSAHLAELMAAVNGQGAGRALVVTESVFSMEGDVAPLRELAAVAARYSAMMMVDEAHSTGVFGPNGSGLVCEWALENAVNLSMGTLSKAFGGYGGFVACSETMRELLINHSRALIYTTAPAPAAIGAAFGALDVLARNPELGQELLGSADYFRNALQQAGLSTGQSASQIIPVMIGDNRRTMAVAERLKAQGIIAAAIRPPTVPEGTSRLRFSLTLAHTRSDMERTVEILTEAARAEGVL